MNSAQSAHFLVLHCQLGIFFNYWMLTILPLQY
ncbi:MAG: hypothetical protein ACJAS5_001171 [Lentimonas sp.]